MSATLANNVLRVQATYDWELGRCVCERGDLRSEAAAKLNSLYHKEYLQKAIFSHC